ncbi:MAG: hypothetical protein HFI72_06540 [Peptococcaceae bacterium]|jgi:hypothetical protein|nr:hypothetical protein [Peptococcaceae bacterium]
MDIDKMNTATRSLFAVLEQELKAMANNVVANYEENMKNRRNNPFLKFENPAIKKYMGLGRSVDSQLGNRLQRIICYIARTRYSEIMVPNIVSLSLGDDQSINCVLYSVSVSIDESAKKKGFDPYRQEIRVNLDDEKDVKKFLHISSKCEGGIIKKAYTISKIDEKSFNDVKELVEEIKKSKSKKMIVDLLCFQEKDKELKGVQAYEIKMGGNLDTKNAKSNAKEVATLDRLFSFIEVHQAYFATCYGTCSSAVKTEIEKEVESVTILNGRAFWAKIIPDMEDTYNYDTFLKCFDKAFKESGLEKELERLSVEGNH